MPGTLVAMGATYLVMAVLMALNPALRGMDVRRSQT